MAAATPMNTAVATATAESTVDDVHAMTLGGPGLGLGFLGAPEARCDGGEGRLAPRDHVERTCSVVFLDEAGDEMDAFDDLLTASVVVEMSMSGDLDRERWSAEVERSRELTLTGLLGDETERTWNGEGESTLSRTRMHELFGEQSVRMESETTIEDVVVAVPRSENPWPLSGSITRHVVVAIVNGPNGDVTRERTVVVTFDGTRYATMTVGGESWEIDLADRRGEGPRKRRRGGR